MPRPTKAGTIEIVKTTKPGFRFMVDAYSPDGIRQRKYFVSRGDAEKLRTLKIQEWSLPEYHVEFTKEEKEAVAMARKHSLDLRQLVLATVATAKANASASPLSVSSVAKDWNGSLKRADRSASYLRSIELTMKRAVKSWGDIRVVDVHPSMVGAVIHGGAKSTPSSQASYRRILHGFFAYAVDMGIREDNPAAKVKSPRISAHSDETVILAPEQCRVLLAAVMDRAPVMMPAVAIGMFAGLRGGEIHRLTWEDVRLSRGLIVVTSGKSKTGNRRMVSVLPCLDALLAPFEPKDKSSKIWPPNGERMWDTIIKAAGWRGARCWAPVAKMDRPPWPRNALRHSFVSYHVAQFQDAARTALESGHSQEVLFKHYRQLASEDEAAEFWTVGRMA